MTPKAAQKYIAGVTEDGRNVYHCLRFCNRIKREFRFTLNPVDVDAEKRGKIGDQFDSRNIPEEYGTKGMEPIDAVVSALNNGWIPGDAR